MKLLKQYVSITLGCALMALAFDWFYAPNELTLGGFTGIAQVINFFAPALPVGVTVIVLNAPLFLMSLKRFGKRFLVRSFFAVAVNSIFIDLINAVYTFQPMDKLLGCIYGGVLVGVSLGWLLREEATTGGTELGAWLLKAKIPGLSIGTLCLAIDLTIIVFYAAVFRSLENALYGGIALYISTKVMDMVVYGGSAAKLAYIISNEQEKITHELLARDMGVTRLTAEGAYTHNDKPVLLCAVRRREIVAVKRLVNEIDPTAFFIVCDAREVLGEGFGEYVTKALTARGFKVSSFETAKEAAEYLNTQIDGATVGFGGSITLEELGLYALLSGHNTVFSHWHLPEGGDAAALRAQAAGSEHYLLSANGIAETGEIINIDGAGNRVASAIYGHKKVWIVAGKNKLAPTYDEALWRARNIAAPKNAQRLHAKTPCAVKADHCYDCKSPGRICRALTVLWGAMMGSDMEVVLVNEDLGY